MLLPNLVPRVSPLFPWDVKRRDPGNEVDSSRMVSQLLPAKRCGNSIGDDLHGTTLSHATSLRQTYDCRGVTKNVVRF